LKIIIWSANFLPNLGGVERYTYHIAKEFLKKGNKITVITSNTDNLKTFEVIENIQIIRLDTVNLLNGRFPVLKFNKKNKMIINNLKKEKFDVSIINTRFYIHSLVGSIFSKKNVKKSLLIEHGTGHFTVNNKFWDKLGEFYEHVISFLVKKNIKNFYGVSEECNKWLQHFRIKAKGVFYNSIDKNVEKDETFDLRKEYNIDKNKKICVFTGRLIKEKGIFKLINTFNKLDSEDVCLFIIGDGEVYEEIKKNNKNRNIVITGRMEHKKIMKALESTDIFLLPTDFPEGLPTSILEAGLEKCAIIASNRGGTPEVIVNEEYGIVLKKNCEEEILEKLKLLLNNAEIIEKMGRNIQKRILENFEWEVTANKILLEIKKI
jgi:hypothetical protein